MLKQETTKLSKSWVFPPAPLPGLFCCLLQQADIPCLVTSLHSGPHLNPLPSERGELAGTREGNPKSLSEVWNPGLVHLPALSWCLPPAAPPTPGRSLAGATGTAVLKHNVSPTCPAPALEPHLLTDTDFGLGSFH